MISIRIREWGSADWTSGTIVGDLEESVAEALLLSLEGRELHIQAARNEGDWCDLEDIDWLSDPDA